MAELIQRTGFSQCCYCWTIMSDSQTAHHECPAWNQQARRRGEPARFDPAADPAYTKGQAPITRVRDIRDAEPSAPAGIGAIRRAGGQQ